MKICKYHWEMCRKAIDDRGMSGLVSKSGKEAVDRAMSELKGEIVPFDPLMAMNNHWWSNALRNGGLYLMNKNETGENDGEYCPICEYEKHAKGFAAEKAIGAVADQMQTYARQENLIPEEQ